MRTIHIDASVPYDVLIGEGLLDRSGELTAKVVPPCRALIVTDDTVDELYGDRVMISFRYAGFDAERFAFPAGEASKNIRTLEEILEMLGEARFSRTDLIVALGGGVSGDIAGFAAAVYARGMRFVQIPTTLLAAVDSSVGGKTAVDLRSGKNLAGAFHQPSLVVADTQVLGDLPEEILSCGMGEVIKYGVLYDRALFDSVKGGVIADLDAVVERCVALKRDVVAEDEFDTGARAFLNLGHTFGHAIEVCSNLAVPHGRAVATGLVMAASAAGCGADMIRELSDCLRANRLPTHCDFDAATLARAALADKKRSGGTITLVLPEEIGKCRLKKIPVGELCEWFARALRAQEEMGL